MKILGIIQARTGSHRLPKKMLKKIGNYKTIEWVIERVKLSSKLDDIILATSQKKEDDILEKIAKKRHIKVFRGDENDVLNRYYKCAKNFNAVKNDIIVRICADNPLISFELIDWTIAEHIKSNADITFSGSNERTKWPDGFGCEVSNFQLLEKLEQITLSLNEREHVFGYVWNNPEKFSINYLCAPSEYQYPDIKLDIDYLEDYNFMKKFIENQNIRINSLIKEIIKKYMCWIQVDKTTAKSEKF